MTDARDNAHERESKVIPVGTGIKIALIQQIRKHHRKGHKMEVISEQIELEINFVQNALKL